MNSSAQFIPASFFLLLQPSCWQFNAAVICPDYVLYQVFIKNIFYSLSCNDMPDGVRVRVHCGVHGIAGGGADGRVSGGVEVKRSILQYS